MTINNFPTSEEILEKYPQIKAIEYIDGPSPAVTLTHCGIKEEGKLCEFYASPEYVSDLYLNQFHKFLNDNIKGDCKLIWRQLPKLLNCNFHSFIEKDFKIYPEKEVDCAWVYSRLFIKCFDEVINDK
jgi:hypothetical protein